LRDAANDATHGSVRELAEHAMDNSVRDLGPQHLTVDGGQHGSVIDTRQGSG